MTAGDFVLPDGSLFDFEVGLDETLPAARFHGYETFLAGTRERLAMYGLRPKKVCAFQNISAEVGDDEIDVGSTPEFAAGEFTVYSKFLGVKVSEEDTSINPRFGNFAEDLVIVPDGYEQTYRYARQTSDFRNMAFLDVPKLRLAIDIRPGRMNHSSTNDGKAGLLGSRLAWLPVSSPVRCMWEIFNLYQDINLGLIRDDKFAYLPTALGGYGKPIPFNHAPNFEAFAVRYKQGTHAPLARELVRRTNTRFREYTVEHRYHTDPVLSAVSRLQSSWHDWIKGKSLYAPTCWLEAPPEVAQYRVGKHGEDVRLDAALSRLNSAGYLVTESDLAVAYEHNKLCASLLSSDTYLQFKEKREAARKEWMNLSTFSMRLYGLLEPLGVDQNLHSVLREEEYQEFWLSVTKKKLHLRSFLRQENFYDRRAKDHVYLKGPMMVKVAMMPQVTQMRRRYWFEPVTDAMDDIETKEEFDILYEWVKNPIGKPRSLRVVEDDPFIKQVIRDGDLTAAYCIVTDDIALCREIFLETRRWVCRVPVKWYYMETFYGEGGKPWERECSFRWPHLVWQTLEDSGSIESYEEIGFRDGLPIKWPSERPFQMTKLSFKDNRRVRTQRTFPEVEENPEWAPYRFPDAYVFAPGQFLQRKKHPHRRGWA
nr:MAG: RdRp [Plasmopara viticola lesion associated narnavirus 6]